MARACFESKTFKMEVDINTQLYPIEVGDRRSISLVLTAHSKNIYNRETLALVPSLKGCDYVMFGIIFEMETLSKDEIAIFASFGGLIMKLEGRE